MKELTLGAALQKEHGPRKELERMLTGRNAEDTLEALGRFLRKEKNPLGVGASKDHYQSAGEAMVTAEDPFIAKDHFVVDETPAARVKIGYMNDAFRAHFLPIVEEGASTARLVASSWWGEYRLFAVCALVDNGIRQGAHLAHLWELLHIQRNGRGSGEGALNLNQSNVFYSYGTDGHLWALDVQWGYRPNNENDGGEFHCTGWGIYAFPLSHSFQQFSHVFSIVG